MMWCSGGMGIGSLVPKNGVLLGNRWWGFREEKQAPQKRVVLCKYGEDKWALVSRRVPRYTTSCYGERFHVSGMSLVSEGSVQ